MGKKLREVMTPNPSTVSSDSPVTGAAKIMRDEDVGIVPIVEGDRLVGTVTDRDIAIRVIAEGKEAQSTTVRATPVVGTRSNRQRSGAPTVA